MTTFLRIEFQDGKRRASSQSYHGSGRAHAHQLDYVSKARRAEDLQALKLHASASASAEQPAPLAGYILGSQSDQKTETPCKIWTQPSQTAQDGEVHLYHSKTDHDLGIRAFFAPLLEVTKCHQDVQIDSGGQGNYAAYTAKYAPKFSDALHEELLNDDVDANSLAASVLSRYKPGVPEMVLQMCGTIVHQWNVTTTSKGKRNFQVPTPDQANMPQEVQLYMASPWRSEEMTLLEFLRKSNNQGEIAGWLKDCWKEAGHPDSLEDFANGYVCDGEKIVACSLGSRLRDKFYGQWLMLHVPFRSPDTFALGACATRVPETDKYLAACYLCQHPKARHMWQTADDGPMLEEMLLEGVTGIHRQAVVEYVHAQRRLVQQYISGELQVPEGKQVQGPKPQEHSLRIQQWYADAVADGSKTVEARVWAGTAAKIKEGDILYLGNLRTQVEDLQWYSDFTELLTEVGFENAVPEAGSLEQAVETYHAFQGYQAAAQKHGVVAFWLHPVQEPAQAKVQGNEEWNQEQQRWLTLMRADLQRAQTASWAASEGDLDEARAECNKKNSIRVLEGPPGTGKTTVAKHFVQEAVGSGLSVLWAVYTAQLAARIRAEVPSAVTVATCHQAFALGAEMAECAYNLVGYDVVIVDEFSQLRGADFVHIDQLRGAVDNAMAFGMLGDRFQMSGFGMERPWHVPAWRFATHQTNLHRLYRCKDPEFRKVLNVLRTSKPTCTGAHGTLRVQDIVKHRRAWKGHFPKVQDVARLLQKHPETTMMAVTRKGTSLLNDLAVQALFGQQYPLATVAGDLETNPDNYDEHGALKPVSQLCPLQVPCFAGMKVFFTKNVDKDRDYINGMRGTVETFDWPSRALIVLTDSQHRIAVRPWTDRDLGNKAYCPIKPGYASTILKLAGAELPHAVVWLDTPHVPAAAYTALSRVAYGSHVLLGGDLQPDHFTPAAP